MELNGTSQHFLLRALYSLTLPIDSSTHLSNADSDASPLHSLPFTAHSNLNLDASKMSLSVRLSVCMFVSLCIVLRVLCAYIELFQLVCISVFITNRCHCDHHNCQIVQSQDLLTRNFCSVHRTIIPFCFMHCTLSVVIVCGMDVMRQ